MTLKELSKITGYSVSTLSKAFSGSREVSRETRAAIVKKAEELGCYYKYNKIKYGKKIIAILCPDTADAYYASIVSDLNRTLEKKNATVTVSLTGFSLKTEQELTAFYSCGRADGIIVIEGRSQAKKHTPVPMIYLNPFSENPYADTVNTDFYTGIAEAIGEFCRNGHKKIGFIGDRHTEDKLRLFYKATERLGVSTYPEYIAVESTRFEEAGYNGMERMIKSGNMPTALLAAYDDIAIGAIHCMEKHGLKCPEDMSVIGIDNIKTASYEHISLTTISSNTEEMNSIAAAILFKKIENRAFNVFQSVTVKSTLVLRNSVKNISGN